jgi:hypothetical protein
MWIIFGSLVAFLVSQLVDVFVFHKIKKATGEAQCLVARNGEHLVSQLVDSSSFWESRLESAKAGAGSACWHRIDQLQLQGNDGSCADACNLYN